jgi:hypothetical protein
LAIRKKVVHQLELDLDQGWISRAWRAFDEAELTRSIAYDAETLRKHFWDCQWR